MTESGQNTINVNNSTTMPSSESGGNPEMDFSDPRHSDLDDANASIMVKMKIKADHVFDLNPKLTLQVFL